MKLPTRRGHGCSWPALALLTAALAVWLVSVVPASAQQEPITGDPQQWVLTLADLPPGFSLEPDRTGVESNEVLAAKRPDPEAALAFYQERGRITGFAVAFKKGGLAALTSTALIYNSASIYQTEEGAQSSLDASSSWATAEGAALVSVPPIGDATFAVSTAVPRERAYGFDARIYSISFRKRNVRADVLTAGTPTGASFDETLRLARAVEAKIP